MDTQNQVCGLGYETFLSGVGASSMPLLFFDNKAHVCVGSDLRGG